MNFPQYLLLIVEWVGTVAFAISGAATAIERRLDLFGVVFMAVITATGGGCIRDVLLGHTPPLVFTNWSTALIAVVVACFVFLFAWCKDNRFVEKYTPLSYAVDLADALGLGLFAVVGTQIAMDAGHTANVFLCIFMGGLTGCGGGALRDMMSREIPFVFTKHVYALAAIAGAGLYYVLVAFSIADAMTATLTSAALTFIIRLLAIYYRWNLPKVGGYENTYPK